MTQIFKIYADFIFLINLNANFKICVNPKNLRYLRAKIQN